MPLTSLVPRWYRAFRAHQRAGKALRPRGAPEYRIRLAPDGSATLWRRVDGRWWRVRRPLADWPALLGHRPHAWHALMVDAHTERPGDVPPCWRCWRRPVAVFGVPCSHCRRILRRQYAYERQRAGRRWLYLPADWDLAAGLGDMREGG